MPNFSLREFRVLSVSYLVLILLLLQIFFSCFLLIYKETWDVKVFNLAIIFGVFITLVNRFGFDFFLKNKRSLLFLIIAVGFFIRFYWHFFSGIEQTSDAAFYVQQGREILAGKYFLSPYKQSGPGMMSAFSMWIFKSELEWIAILPVFFVSVAFIPLIYWLGKNLFGTVAGVLSAFLFAIWPEPILYTNLVTAHWYQGFFICLGLCFATHPFQLNEVKRKIKWNSTFCFIAGLSIGFSQYMRGSSLLFFVSFLLILYFLQLNYSKVFALILGFILITAPILVFNWNQFEIFSFSPAQNSGMSLFIGTDIGRQGHYYDKYWEDVEKQVSSMIQAGTLNPKANSQHNLNLAATTVAIKRIMDRPMEMLKLAGLHKMPIFWAEPASLAWSLPGSILEKRNPEISVKISSAHERSFAALVLLCCLSLIVALFRMRDLRGKPYFWAICSGSSGIAIVHFFAEIQSQYHMVLEWVFPLLGAGLLSFLLQTKSNRDSEFGAAI